MQTLEKTEKVMNLSVSGIEGIKLVKNSTVFEKDGFIYAVHYGTVIFQRNIKTCETLINLNCSTTSNRLIDRCLAYYYTSREEATDTHKGSKWNYSGPMY